jgi:hypothetical protein
MPRTRSLDGALVLLIAFLVLATPAAASDASADPPRQPRIRTADARMHALIDQGLRESVTFRALVERIRQSDVVVYVRCDGDRYSRVAGRLTFVSTAGGFRYVVVRLKPMQTAAEQIAMLAHELQHAVEIADAPAIVDSASLAREYLRIGHVNRWSETPGIAFDTDAAVEAGRQVLGELSRMTGD